MTTYKEWISLVLVYWVTGIWVMIPTTIATYLGMDVILTIYIQYRWQYRMEAANWWGHWTVTLPVSFIPVVEVMTYWFPVELLWHQRSILKTWDSYCGWIVTWLIHCNNSWLIPVQWLQHHRSYVTTQRFIPVELM